MTGAQNMSRILLLCRDKSIAENDYISALRSAGFQGKCLACAPGDEPPALEAVHGLLICGGLDIHPRRWDPLEALHPLSNVDEARDALEIEWILKAWQARIPILGICRGEQILNVALGGSLIQDIPDHFQIPREVHQFGTRQDASPHHDIIVDTQSCLGRILGTPQVGVNSRHHQAVFKVAPELRAVAWHPGPQNPPLIEAIEAQDPTHWAIGVQWHPENLIQAPEAHGRAALKLFQAFVQIIP